MNQLQVRGKTAPDGAWHLEVSYKWRDHHGGLQYADVIGVDVAPPDVEDPVDIALVLLTRIVESLEQDPLF